MARANLAIVGVGSQLHRFDGATWTRETIDIPGFSNVLGQMWISEDGSSGYAAPFSGAGFILRYTGSTWVREDIPAPGTVQGFAVCR
jgi:uncharacterized protein (DUF1684 family)